MIASSDGIWGIDKVNTRLIIYCDSGNYKCKVKIILVTWIIKICLYVHLKITYSIIITQFYGIKKIQYVRLIFKC